MATACYGPRPKEENLTMTLISELIDVPLVVNEGDFVLKLTSGVEDEHAAQTIGQYVVTDGLLTAFDEALGLIGSAVANNGSRAAYLHGSFGSGKSHFMAVMHLLLSGNHHARSKAELHAPWEKHKKNLDGKTFLQVPLHFLTATSMEAAILGGYVRHVRDEHPDAPLPAVFLADAVLEKSLPVTRTDLGDEHFVAGLNEAAGGDGTWGEFGDSWTIDRVDAALGSNADAAERTALAAAYNQRYNPGAVDGALNVGEGFIDLDDGLAAISTHAQSLGYDAIILFLDELILWLAASIGNLEFVHQEAQKLAKLVESNNADRPVPIVSFVARQRDLKELVGDQVAGAEVMSLGDTLQLMAGRFTRITLEDRNLPLVAKERLLKPKDAEAEQQLRSVVDELREEIRATLLTSDTDIEIFRSVYPFSPALVETLVAVSEALQRDRTALKVMLHLLSSQRDTLELGQFVPVGDLWDVVSSSDEPFSSDLKKAFDRAKKLYNEKLEPMLLEEHAITDETPADAPSRTNMAADARILKTLLLASLVERVAAFTDLSVSRLVALNWGSVKAPIPGRETQVLANKVRAWAGRIGEIKVGIDQLDPIVSIALVDVDTDGIIARASDVFDNLGARKRLLRQLIVSELTGELGDTLDSSYKHEWRGTDRHIDVVFGNLRDTSDVPDAALKAQPGKPKLLIDFPFDETGHTPEEDLERLDRYVAANPDSTTSVCWMPSFFNQQGLSALKTLVTLEQLFTGPNRFEDYTSELSDNQRREARPVLENRREQLRRELGAAIRAAYGVVATDHPLLDNELSLADHFRSLDPAMTIRPTTAPNFGEALGELCDQMLAHLHPGHPTFGEKVTPAKLKTVWEELQRAIGDVEKRINVENRNRPVLRNIANPLQLGTMHESHFVVDPYWTQQLDRYLAAAEQAGSPLTVGELREKIDETKPSPKGMAATTADLIVVSVAAQTSHALTRGGLPVVYDPRTPLPPETVLERQELPTDDEWNEARQRAQALFGYNPPPLITAPAAEELASQLRAKADGFAMPCRDLQQTLADRYGELGIANGNRLDSAAGSVTLSQSLVDPNATQLIRAFTSFEIPGSPQSFGRSMSTAEAVGQVLKDANWGLLTIDDADIRSELEQVLKDDEFVTPLDAALRGLETRATAVLVRRGQGPVDPPGVPPQPPGVPGGAGEVARRVDEATIDATVEELRDAVKDGPVDIRWKPVNET